MGNYWTKKARGPAVALAVVYLGLWSLSGGWIVPTLVLGLAVAGAVIPATVIRVREMQRELPGRRWWSPRLWMDYNREQAGRLRIQEAWHRACVGEKLVSGTRTPALIGLKRTPAGDFTGRLNSRSGVAVTKIVPKVGDLAQVMNCNEIVVTTAPGGTGKIEFRWSDPLVRTVLPGDLAKPPKGYICVGVKDDGRPALLQVFEPKTGEVVFRSTLIGAATGAGKSYSTHAIIAGFIHAGIPLELWVYDHKGGVEFGQYEPYVHEATSSPLFTVKAYEQESGKDIDLLKRMTEARKERMAVVKASGKRYHVVTPEHPIVLFVCDEFFGLHPKLIEKKAGHVKYLHHLLSEGRAGGYAMVACTQQATVNLMGDYRGLIDYRFGLRTKTKEQTVAIFGTQDVADLAPAHRISRKQPGVFYFDDGAEIVKGRFAFYDDDAVELIAKGLLPRGMGRKQEREQRTAVYRFYSWNYETGGRRLEYIGKAVDPSRRYDEHAADAKRGKYPTAEWWPHVQRFRQMDGEGGQENHFVATWYDYESEALEHEQAGIKRELPAWNDLHNGKNPIRARKLRAVRDDEAA